jgi:hypothetical protein
MNYNQKQITRQGKAITREEMLQLRGGVEYQTYACTYTCDQQGGTFIFSSTCESSECAETQCEWFMQYGCSIFDCYDCHVSS